MKKRLDIARVMGIVLGAVLAVCGGTGAAMAADNVGATAGCEIMSPNVTGHIFYIEGTTNTSNYGKVRVKFGSHAVQFWGDGIPDGKANCVTPFNENHVFVLRNGTPWSRSVVSGAWQNFVQRAAGMPTGGMKSLTGVVNGLTMAAGADGKLYFMDINDKWGTWQLSPLQPPAPIVQATPFNNEHVLVLASTGDVYAIRKLTASSWSSWVQLTGAKFKSITGYYDGLVAGIDTAGGIRSNRVKTAGATGDTWDAWKVIADSTFNAVALTTSYNNWIFAYSKNHNNIGAAKWSSTSLTWTVGTVVTPWVVNRIDYGALAAPVDGRMLGLLHGAFDPDDAFLENLDGFLSFAATLQTDGKTWPAIDGGWNNYGFPCFCVF